MIEYETLTSEQHEEFEKNMALMERQTFEQLYYFLYGANAPYDGYHADGVLSPWEEDHNEYFREYQIKAKELFSQWKPKLESLGNGDVNCVLVGAGRSIRNATDMIDLTWAAMQLKKVVSVYLEKERAA